MLTWENLSTWSILIVDDEPDNLEVLADTLRFMGVAVRTAEDGERGLEVVRDFAPDLIVTDLSMPRMDGWKLRSCIKTDARTAHIPVVALSAHAMSGDKERALEAGFDGYLTKPVNIPTLLDDLRAALSERAMLPKAVSRI